MFNCNYCNKIVHSKEGLRRHKVAYHKDLYCKEIYIKNNKPSTDRYLYELNPNRCTTCLNPLDYKSKHNKFCSHSCSAKFNNTTRGSDFYEKRIRTGKNCLEDKICVNCDKEFRKPKSYKYCSAKCSHEHRSKTSFEINQHKPNVSRQTQRKRLLLVHGHICTVCSGTVWNGLPIPLEVDHIDGNATNNIQDNIRLICPNCHAQTDTYKARNKGNGRMSRGHISA